jgi:hypothetical protein
LICVRAMRWDGLRRTPVRAFIAGSVLTAIRPLERIFPESMKKDSWLHHIIAEHTKDVIAIMIVFTWCVSVFIPNSVIDEVTQRSFERVMLLVLGFYFGAKKYDSKPS